MVVISYQIRQWGGLCRHVVIMSHLHMGITQTVIPKHLIHLKGNKGHFADPMHLRVNIN